MPGPPRPHALIGAGERLELLGILDDLADGDEPIPLDAQLGDAGEQAAGVGVERVVEEVVTLAYSTTRPAYMTQTTSAFSATTPRSWVMSMTPMSRES
jgi:hypothetical protein